MCCRRPKIDPLVRELCGLPGMRRLDENGSLVMFVRGKGVTPLEDAIRRAVQALQNLP